jgi:hypothetical protein
MPIIAPALRTLRRQRAGNSTEGRALEATSSPDKFFPNLAIWYLRDK